MITDATRALQLRDIEILVIFDALIAGAPASDLGAAARETAKRCDCSETRVDDALVRVQWDRTHLYWRQP